MYEEEHSDSYEDVVSSAGMGVADDGSQSDVDGTVHVAEDVIAQIASRALASVEGVVPSSASLMSNFRMGRKAINGVRIAVAEADPNEVSVDTYVSVKYGLRIPDVCWDIQAAIKDQVEKFSGKKVKSVNVYVQGMVFDEDEASASAGSSEVSDHQESGD